MGLPNADSPSGPDAAAKIELRVVSESEHEICVFGLTESQFRQIRLSLEKNDWSELFQVRVDRQSDKENPLPAILGRYEPTRDGVVFKPRFRFVRT